MTDALNLDGPNPWQTQSTRVVYDNGRLRLCEDRVIQPDGEPWRRNSWEIPAGQCEPDEDPLDGARRELGEEVGLQAAIWEPLGTLYSSATFSTRYHLFLARSLSPVTSEHERDGSEEDLITHRLPLVDAVAAAMDGRIAHGMTVAALLRVARRLGL